MAEETSTLDTPGEARPEAQQNARPDAAQHGATQQEDPAAGGAAPADNPARPGSPGQGPSNSNTPDELIYFKDAVGRKYRFPFEVAKTWKNMEELIRQAFVHIEIIGPHVVAGHYDLVEDGNIVLPSLWEKTIKPGMAIGMHMWPIERPQQPLRPPPRPPWMQPGGPGMPAPAGSRGPPLAGSGSIPEAGTNQPKTRPVYPWYAGKPGTKKKEKNKPGAGGMLFLQPANTKPRGKAQPVPAVAPESGPAAPAPAPAPVPAPVPLPTLVAEPVNLSWYGTKKKPAKPRPTISISSPAPMRRQDWGQRGPPPGYPDSSSSDSSDNNLDDSSDESTVASSSSTDNGPFIISRHQSTRDRKQALKKELIVSRTRSRPGLSSASAQPPLRRQTTPLGKPGDTMAPRLKRLEISSAQVYFDDLDSGGAARLELIRRAVGSGPGAKMVFPGTSSGDVPADAQKGSPEDTQSATNKATQSRMVWLHATTDVMNFKSFEDVAMFELPLDNQTRVLLVHLLQSIRSKKLDEEWYIKPGTVLRCDGEGANAVTPNGSVLFASIPNLHTSPAHKGAPAPKTDADEICPDHRLDEAMGLATMIEEAGKGWYRGWNDRGTHARPSFWVRQTWILVTGSCVLTYGSLTQEELSGHVITTLDDIFSEDNGDRGIRVIDNEGRSFYIPAANRKSFYELQGTTVKQLERIEDEKIDVSTVRLSLPSGQEITQETWPDIQKSAELSWVKVEFTLLDCMASSVASSYSGSSSASVSDGSDSNGSAAKRSVSISLRSHRTGSGHSFLAGSISEEEEGFAADKREKKSDKGNFWVLASETKPKEAPLFVVPKLNRKVPEFLSWSVPEEDKEGAPPRAPRASGAGAAAAALALGQAMNTDKAFREGIFRTESRLVRVHTTDAGHAAEVADDMDDEKRKKHASTNAVIDDLFRTFGDKRLYEDTEESTFDQTSQQRQKLGKAKTKDTTGPTSDPSPNATSLLDGDLDLCAVAGEFFDVAVSILESFVSVQYSAPLVSRYFGALHKAMEVASDPPSGPEHRPSEASSSGSSPALGPWVISQSRLRRDNIRTVGPTTTTTTSSRRDSSKKRTQRCRACTGGTLYTSYASAAAHLRQAHSLPTEPSSDNNNNTLSRYIMSPTRAMDVQRHDDQLELFLGGRDTLAMLLRKLVNIQNGVVHDSELRAKRGLPFELLDALTCVVAYVCALPSLLRRISTSYVAVVHEDMGQTETGKTRDAGETYKKSKMPIEPLMDSKAEYQKRALSRLAAEAEKQIRRAERKLMFSVIGPGNEDGPGSFQMSVGPHYVAAQIACNLLTMPVYGGKGSAALYDTSVAKMHAQIFHRPNKRQIPSITALANELNMLQAFQEWQAETIHALELVFNPGTYPWRHSRVRGGDSSSNASSNSSRSSISNDSTTTSSRSSRSRRRRRGVSSNSEWSIRSIPKEDATAKTDGALQLRAMLFSLERRLLAQQTRRLARETRGVGRALDRCSRMVESVRQMTEIMAEDQSRVLFIFTTVTVVFLPLSFVAAYVSMNGGTIGMDWAGIQRLFWTVAGPLTVGVLAFCVAATQAQAQDATRLRAVLLTQPWLAQQFVWAYMVWWLGEASRKLQRRGKKKAGGGGGGDDDDDKEEEGDERGGNEWGGEGVEYKV